MSTLRAGNLRHKIDIWQQKEIQDPNNGSISHRWVLAFERVSAGVNPVSAREFIAAQASQYQYDVRITIRYNPQIDNTMRVVFRGSTYEIKGVLPDDRSGLEWLTLFCQSGVEAYA